MDLVQQVHEFIDENIIHTEAWDSAEEKQRSKAVNHAKRTLERLFPKAYTEGVPVEHLAEQCVWLLKLDEMIQKSEMGVTYFSIDGINVTISAKDNSLCPFLLDYHNLGEGWNVKRKVARYSTSLFDSNRKGWC